MSDIVNAAVLDAALLKHHREVKALIDQMNEQIKESGKANPETLAKLEKAAEAAEAVGKRLDAVEARISRGLAEMNGEKSVGTKFIESDGFKAMAAGSTKRARMEVKVITNTPGQNQPLVPADRVAGIVANPNRRLTIRDLLMPGRTQSNAIEFTQEVTFTNNAAVQAGGSPIEYENITKAESNISFRLQALPVVTIAHFILASRQVLTDAPMLQSYIDGRLMYGLKLEEEDQLLNGDGTAGNISGLWTNRTAYARSKSNDTKIDTLRRAVTQCQTSEYAATAHIVNPQDWESIELTKDSQGRYVVGNPQSTLAPRLWGLPVVVTNSMPVTQFLTGAFDMAAQLFDREDATVEASREDGTNFQKNMVTILAEERLALAVYRTSGLVGGNYPTT